MGLLKNMMVRGVLYRHLHKKPSDKELNDRLLDLMKHPSLLYNSTLTVLVQEYHDSLPLVGHTRCSYLPNHHKDPLFDILNYSLDNDNPKASSRLAEILSDAGHAVEVASLAREKDNPEIGQIAVARSQLRLDIVREKDDFHRRTTGFGFDYVVDVFEDEYRAVQEALKP